MERGENEQNKVRQLTDSRPAINRASLQYLYPYPHTYLSHLRSIPILAAVTRTYTPKRT